jgi:hypothetical protein
LFASVGWVIVLVGHCTRNDCALAPTVAIPTRRIGNQNLDCFFMAVQPPSELLVGAHVRRHQSMTKFFTFAVWERNSDEPRPFLAV